ncbi:hypothetical protein [Microseira sp. BLCC-F43]|uniref:NACHT C-terminal helical domain 2-containing protein n=1 Tax=Microseira sp. BLCC-F43 TaxID=3153602 RepID=UPI0035BB244B
MQHLVSYINEKHWREVFLLTAGMLPNADCLLQLMKQQIDWLVAADEKLQRFLMWVNQKSHLVEPPLFYATHQSIDAFTVNNYSKKLAFRLFYSTLGIIHSSFNKAINNFLLPNHFFPSRRLPLSFIQLINEVLHISCNFFSSTDFVIDLLLTDILNQIYYISHRFSSDSHRYISDSHRYINACLNNILNRNTNLEFKRSLQELREQLPDPLADEKKCEEWWQENGKAWTDQLRSVMIKYRNIGHNWLFSEQQKELLSQYYDANKLLVDCLNSGCNVTPAVREEIEETLLLPIAEIEKRGNCQNR